MIHAHVAHLAERYGVAVHTPEDRAVQLAYNALKTVINRQYDVMVTRLDLTIVRTPHDPYADRNEPHTALFEDIRKRQRLQVWADDHLPGDHPLNAQFGPTTYTWNTVFRAVHDFYGHFMTGSDFSFTGELTAYKRHRASMPESAWPALNAETIAQSCYHRMWGTFPTQRACLIDVPQHIVDTIDA